MDPKKQAFINEYRELCKKHNLMVLSEGEIVVVAEYEDNLWGLERYTEEEDERRAKWKETK